MKRRLILAGALTGCLLASPAPAEPFVELDGSTFTVNEAVNDQILAQIRADMGKLENKSELAFKLEDISNEDLAKICALYPRMIGLDVISDKVTDLSPLAKVTDLMELHLEVKAADFSPLKGLTGLTGIHADSAQLGPDLSWMSGMTGLEKVVIRSDAALSLKGLPSLPQLEEIVLSAEIDDLTPLVEAMPALRSIDLKGAVIADLSPLSKLDSLEEVNLYGATVKDFSALAACPKLEKLTYYATKDADYSTLGKLTQVTELDGGLTMLDDIGWLSGLPNLRVFDVFSEYVTDYTPLAKSNIEQFQIWSMRVPVGDVAAVGQAVSLRKLTLWDVEGAVNSKSLAGLVNLEEVVVRGYNTKKGGEPFDLNAAAGWSKVRKASFENARFINSDGLAGMSAVEELRLYKANLKAEKPLDLAFLSKLNSLRNLTIDECKISNPEALAGCTGLTHVRITKTEGMPSLAPLHKLPNLKRVTVSKGGYPETELKGFDPKVKVVQN